MSDTFEVGEKVIIGNSYWSKVVEVTKVTPTGQVVVDFNDIRFKDCRLMGERGYDSARLRKWTAEGEAVIMRRARKLRLLSKVIDTNFRRMTLGQLERVCDAIEEGKEAK